MKLQTPTWPDLLRTVLVFKKLSLMSQETLQSLAKQASGSACLALKIGLKWTRTD